MQPSGDVHATAEAESEVRFVGIELLIQELAGHRSVSSRHREPSPVMATSLRLISVATGSTEIGSALSVGQV